MLLVGCGSKETTETASNNTSSSEENNKVASDVQLPPQMTWSVYDVGSTGYAEASAIANEITNQYGTNIRMIPSGTSVGRMIPLKNGSAQIGRIGDEFIFSFEGIHEFAEKSWGPQDVRLVWAPTTNFGLAVREDSDIKSIQDLKGKKIPWITANHSINLKTEAMLKFGRVSLVDVELVDLTSYGAQADALKAGQVDVVSMNPQASSLFEIDTSIGIRWMPMPEDDKNGWTSAQELVSWIQPDLVDTGAGLTNSEPVWMIRYVYPVVAYASQDKDTIKALVQGLIDTYGKYKDVLPPLAAFSKDEVLVQPVGIPFHEGTVEILKELDLWTPEADEENNRLIERGKQLKSLWDGALDQSKKDGISDSEFTEYWLNKRNESLK